LRYDESSFGFGVLPAAGESFFFGCQVVGIDRIKKAFLLIRKALRSFVGFALSIQRANAFLRQGGVADASYQVVGNSGQN
jgi:hypothetical protein